MERHLHAQLFSQVSLVNYHLFFVLPHRGGGGGGGGREGNSVLTRMEERLYSQLFSKVSQVNYLGVV